MKLPIPIATDKALYTDAEIDAPKAAVIADTRKAVDKGNIYGAIKVFVSGGVQSLQDQNGGSETDQVKIQQIVNKMPFKTAEMVSIMAAVEIDGDDGFEGYYVCPRCGEKVIHEYVTEDDDSRDYVEDLRVTYAPSDEPLVHEVDLERPVEVVDKTSGAHILTIDSFTMEAPTIGTAEKSRNRYGANDSERQQYAMYIDSLKMVNGEEVSKKWKSEWGMFLFENMSSKDRKKVFAEVNRYGLEQAVPLTCKNCGKEWKARVNTANFFESALQSE